MTNPCGEVRLSLTGGLCRQGRCQGAGRVGGLRCQPRDPYGHDLRQLILGPLEDRLVVCVQRHFLEHYAAHEAEHHGDCAEHFPIRQVKRGVASNLLDHDAVAHIEPVVVCAALCRRIWQQLLDGIVQHPAEVFCFETGLLPFWRSFFMKKDRSSRQKVVHDIPREIYEGVCLGLVTVAADFHYALTSVKDRFLLAGGGINLIPPRKLIKALTITRVNCLDAFSRVRVFQRAADLLAGHVEVIAALVEVAADSAEVFLFNELILFHGTAPPFAGMVDSRAVLYTGELVRPKCLIGNEIVKKNIHEFFVVKVQKQSQFPDFRICKF